jgi:hypothetical protein
VSFLQSRTGSARQGIGKHVLRKEDARLVSGRGCYSDDVNFPGQAYACFVRSPHAHASIGRIDTAAARATPGVIAVLTGVDAVADGVKPLTHSPVPENPYEEIIRKEDVRFIAPHPVMPADRVRFVGEIVAMVIADTPAAARDGTKQVMIEWSALPAVTMSVAAVADNAPVLYDDVTSNVCVDVKAGDAAETDHAFAGAAHVVRLQTWVHRITGVPMEPRTALATWDPAGGRCTIHVQAGGLGRTQVGHRRRPRCPRERGARDGARCRWKFWDAQLLLPGVCAGGVGGASPRLPGEVVRGPARGVSRRLSRARSRGRGRASARPRRPVPRAAQQQHEQSRRARRAFRPAQQGHGDRHYRL